MFTWDRDIFFGDIAEDERVTEIQDGFAWMTPPEEGFGFDPGEDEEEDNDDDSDFFDDGWDGEDEEDWMNDDDDFDDDVLTIDDGYGDDA